MKKIIITTFALLFSMAVSAQSSKTSSTSTESTSVSVSNSDHDYSVVAIFDEGKAERLKKLIVQSLGEPNETKNNTYEWSLKSSYTLILRSGKLIIDMDKDKTTAGMIKTFERLGSEVQPTLERKQ